MEKGMMMVEAILLGIAQDAGVPQAGCYCDNCTRARNDPDQRQLVVCLGLIDHSTRQSWLIDATPDFREQLHALRHFAPDCPLAGIILTHAHMGHYTGLIHVGLEAMNTRQLPVYATPKLATFLRQNAPWSQLVTLENITLRLLTPNQDTTLSPNLRLLPVPVPHRDEYSDTMAFVVSGSGRKLFYCPDIDSWTDWQQDVRAFVAKMDYALLDAPFFNAQELPGRDLSKIKHPFVTDTIARLARVDCGVCLIHLNHSNPLLANESKRRWVESQGFEVGRFARRWILG
jgi:pyrroloquinoline quinone biosynthesis protein B